MTINQANAITCLSNRDLYARVDAINSSCEKIFGRGDRSKIIQKLSGKEDIALHQYCNDVDDILAFKLGYAEDNLSFYSWLGGVTPDMRGGNLARDLMTTQHRWATEQGYQTVTTRTEQNNERMSTINVAAGFVEYEIITKDDGRKLRCFRKSLRF